MYRSKFHPANLAAEGLNRLLAARLAVPTEEEEERYQRKRPHPTSTKGRRSKWVPHSITPCEVTIGQKYIEEHLASRSAQSRVQANFLAMCELSGLEPDEAIPGYIGQLKESGLASGTIHEYLKAIRLLIRPSTYRPAIKACAAAHADADTTHAADLPGNQLDWLTEKAQPGLYEVLFFLRLTGARLADLRRLQRKQIVFKEEEAVVHIQFRRTKNRTKRSLRKSVEFPISWGGPVRGEVLRAFLQVPGYVKLFRPYTVSYVNRELKKLCAQVDYRSCTSYTFRRAFMDRVIRTVPASERSEFTLHLNGHVLYAHYARFVGEDEEAWEQME